MNTATVTRYRTNSSGSTEPYEVSEGFDEAERLLTYALTAVGVYESEMSVSTNSLDARLAVAVANALSSKKGTFMEATPERVAEARRLLGILNDALGYVELGMKGK